MYDSNKTDQKLRTEYIVCVMISDVSEGVWSNADNLHGVINCVIAETAHPIRPDSERGKHTMHYTHVRT
jgi:hypothetical protein